MPALNNVRVLELAGLAPGPFTGLLLADNGASVLRVDRVQPPNIPSPDVLARNKSSITLDLKSEEGKSFLLQLIPRVDILIDPFRPGVLEKLGLSPHDVLLKLNPRLIVARLTGFRRDGKYAHMAGHDINYLAVSGVLSMLGSAAKVPPLNHPLPPSPPGNILADFAGGGLMCFAGILLALVARSQTGAGQIVETNMVDGVSYLAMAPRKFTKIPGQWDQPRGNNLVDGGCPYYAVYECQDDGKYMSVAALEPQFFEALCQGLGVCEKDWGGKRDDRTLWPAMKRVFETKFRSKTRAEWETVFNGTDACCLPVLTHSEMEANGYEHRPAVTLSETPSIPETANGWSIDILERGGGGEKLLSDWLGWKEGREYVVDSSGYRSNNVAKL
ncbi:CoA-transferase family III domain-containing protein [Aspergillus ambiguus]|uniref:CaiB/BaiF CoA transferase family protein n=1 Tax=Aspergillus ambiguus TaxID=176160 RepID=UPI003CCDBDF0